MADHNELGKLGEELAVDFLKKGYAIIETNFVFQKQKLISLLKKKMFSLLWKSKRALLLILGVHKIL